MLYCGDNTTQTRITGVLSRDSTQVVNTEKQISFQVITRIQSLGQRILKMSLGKFSSDSRFFGA